jgi:hypothetical protein
MDDHHLYQLCQKIEGRKHWFGGAGVEDSRGEMKELFTVKIHMTSTQKFLYTRGITACSTRFTMYI